MFSALKRLAGKENSNSNGAPPGHQTMSHNLQRKFARGVQYNMKIIIKGDRNTGKTCLFQRLQGNKFLQEYIPTEEIQVASIQWSYKTTDDVVKVEVWDVVDKGRKRVPLEGLKIGDMQPAIAPALDAEFLDVYKGTHGVILLMDITKNWTFEYVQREISKIPDQIPVLVLGNHCDMSHHRTVTRDVVTYYIDSVQRPSGKGQIRYTEASMSNGFGLKYLHKYFCIPFLQLQREVLLSQLERNSRESDITLQELDLYQQDSDYDKFLTGLSQKRREVADNVSSAKGSAGPLPVGQGVPITVPASGQAPVRINPITGNQPQNKNPSPNPQKQSSQTTTIASDILLDNKNNTGLVGVLDSSVASVDEFVPDGGVLDKSFLEDNSPPPKQIVPATTRPNQDSDSELSEGGNPLVSGYQDDLDPDDSLHSIPNLPIYQDSNPNQGEVKEIIKTDWVGHLEDRGSPEGGEDSQDNLDNSGIITDDVDNNNPCTVIKNNAAKNKDGKVQSKQKKIKKKSSSKDKDKEKEDLEIKEEKRKRKKSIKKSLNDQNSMQLNELEDFLNSHDTTYEAI